MMMKVTATSVTPASQMGMLQQELTQTLGYADLSEPLKECSLLADHAFARNFAAQAGPESGPWAPRASKHTGKIGEENAGHPLLILSGDLFEAVTSPFGAGHIEDVTLRAVEMGVDLDAVPYARAQNYGHKYDSPFPHTLPAREFEDIDDETADRCAEIMADAMLEELLNA